MKLLTLILVIFLSPLFAKGQFVEIPVSKISGQQVTSRRCIDSTWTLSELCPLEARGLYVIFFSAFINKAEKTIRLVGRVQFSDKVTSGGMAGVEIFKGKLIAGKITSRVMLSETTSGKDYMSNDGFFDITAEMGVDESLFFIRGYFWHVEEFTVSKLFK